MRLPLRIIAPVVTALLCVSGLLAFLWWQLSSSSSLLQQTSTLSTDTDQPIATAINTEPSVPSTDETFMALRQGDLHALNGDWAGAEAAYQKAVDNDGGVPALRKLAQAQLQRRDLDSVRATIAALKQAGAKAEDILLLESIVHLRSGDLAAAESVLAGGDLSPQQHYGKALLAMLQGNHEQAQTELHAVAQGWEPVLRSHARTLLAAYDEFTLFEDSPLAHLHTLIARALAQVQECTIALSLLETVTQTQPEYRDAWIIQGYCQLTTEQPSQALVSLEQAYKIDPQKPEIQYFLGRTYTALEQADSAIIFFEYALQNGFEPAAEVQEHLAIAAVQTADYQRALEQYTALIQSLDASLSAYIGYVETNLFLKHNQEAYIQARAAAERWPKDAKAQLLLAKAALANERTEEAQAALDAAIAIDPLLQEAQALREDIQ